MNSYKIMLMEKELEEKTKRLEEFEQKYAQSVDDRGWTRIFDWRQGAWQQHAPYDTEESVLAYPTVYACITLIQNDIAKLKIGIQRFQKSIWENVPYRLDSLYRKPNSYQNQIQFKAHWINSKLIHGNTYVLKFRVGNRIDELHILDPLSTTPLIADNGDVFYRLGEDRLARIDEDQILSNVESGKQVVVPASEIIHDRFNCLYHPLVGLSPIFAAGTAATMGLKAQNNSKNFIANGSQPGGVLTAPGAISDSTATRLKDYWETKFSGSNSGKIAVVGDGLKYEPMMMSNVDSQLVEQLGWTDEKICSVFHVPAYLVGVGPTPTYNNIEALIQNYYSRCLQFHIESMEMALDEGLGVETGYRTQLDLDGLFRMDQATLSDILSKEVGGGFRSPDEARQKLNLPPVPGGQYPYLQQQNYSLEALAQRDSENPLGKPPPPAEPTEDDMAQMAALIAHTTRLQLQEPIH